MFRGQSAVTAPTAEGAALGSGKAIDLPAEIMIARRLASVKRKGKASHAWDADRGARPSRRPAPYARRLWRVRPCLQLRACPSLISRRVDLPVLPGEAEGFEPTTGAAENSIARKADLSREKKKGHKAPRSRDRRFLALRPDRSIGIGGISPESCGFPITLGRESGVLRHNPTEDSISYFRRSVKRKLKKPSFRKAFRDAIPGVSELPACRAPYPAMTLPRGSWRGYDSALSDPRQEENERKGGSPLLPFPRPRPPPLGAASRGGLLSAVRPAFGRASPTRRFPACPERTIGWGPR